MNLRQLRPSCKHQGSEEGFSLLEMIIACAILMVGILSVVQLVPVSLRSNLRNRMDTMATVIAQRELDQMLAHVQSCPPQGPCSFTDNDGNSISLGGAGSTGAPVVMQGATAVIDFSAGPVSGFNIPTYQDRNDPTGSTFELRWAVFVVNNNNNSVVGWRIILGCRQTNTSQPMLPVSLDTSVQR